MQVTDYKFSGNCLRLNFNKEFKELQIQKVEPMSEASKEMDYMKVGLTFCKPKRCIDLQVNETSAYAIIILEDQAYYMKRTDVDIDGMEMISRGMTALFKEVVPTRREQYGFDQLKSENIFVEVKRRVISQNGVEQS